MITINQYKKVETLEEAYELNQKKSNCIIGGMLWLKMGHQTVQTAIDLSALGLNQIEESEEEFKIGCMTSLRDLEVHEGLNQYTEGAMKEALKHIVGVQFRNCATLGGSIYGRYGFSDVLTVFMAMDSYVELYKGGLVSLKDYAKQKYDRDIIVHIIIKKENMSMFYQSVRNQAKTDFPVLTCAAAKLEDGTYRLALGARPGKAILLTGKDMTAEYFGNYAKNVVETGSNTRGSAEYRKHLVEVLVKRAVLKLENS